MSNTTIEILNNVEKICVSDKQIFSEGSIAEAEWDSLKNELCCEIDPFTGEAVQYYLESPKVFTLDGDGFKLNEVNYEDQLPKKVYVKFLQADIVKRNNSNAFYRTLRFREDQVDRLWVIDDDMFFASMQSRNIPINGSVNDTAQIEQDKLKQEDEGLLHSISKSELIEGLSRTTVVVIGGGTVGRAAMDAAASLNVGEVVYWELPDEKFSEANIQRLPGADLSLLGKSKWLADMFLIKLKSPNTKITYHGAFSGSKEDEVVFKDLLGRRDINKITAFIALDNQSLRIEAYKLCEELDLFTVAPADLANGAQLNIYSNPSVKAMSSKILRAQEKGGNIASTITDIGGLGHLIKNLSKRLVQAYLSGAYGYNPQTYSASAIASGQISWLLQKRARGEDPSTFINYDPDSEIKSFVQNLQDMVSKANMLRKALFAAKEG